MERIWTKVLRRLPHEVRIWRPDDPDWTPRRPKQKRYLLCATTALDADDSSNRLPVGEVFELNDGPIDFKSKAGVAFICSDGSYNLVMGARGDLEQPRLNMWRPKPVPTQTERLKSAHAAPARPIRRSAAT